MNIFLRYPHRPNPTYYARWTDPTGRRWLRNTFETTEAKARQALRLFASATNDGRFDALDTTKARHTPGLPLSIIYHHYLAFPGRKPSHATRLKNIECLRHFLRITLALPPAPPHRAARPQPSTLNPQPTRPLRPDPAPDAIEVSELTGHLVHRYTTAIRQHMRAQGADDLREEQMARSANSVLRQARSIFATGKKRGAALLQYYRRDAALELPMDTLRDFLDEPGFKDVAKTDYDLPSDAVVARTFADLDALEKTDPNLFKAIWLTLGYGLRKSEISAARIAWFITVDGQAWLRGDCLDKSGKRPNILCQLGADTQLAPHLADRPADAWLIEGTPTERTDAVFRRCSTWMRARGWQTQKCIHEFRAYAISQVADGAGDIRTAQKWARHAHQSTTERYARHHTKAAPQIKLTLPTVPVTLLNQANA